MYNSKNLMDKEECGVTLTGDSTVDLKNINEYLEKKRKFTKFDDGKTPLSLVEPSYVVGTAKVLQLGANKYGKYNWQGCGDIDRYKDALLRHLYAYLDGEKIDPESGLSHLYHCSCNLMFLDYFEKDINEQNKK